MFMAHIKQIVSIDTECVYCFTPTLHPFPIISALRCEHIYVICESVSLLPIIVDTPAASHSMKLYICLSVITKLREKNPQRYEDSETIISNKEESIPTICQI